MRRRIGGLLALAACIALGLSVYLAPQPPNALPACVPNGPLACSTVDGFPLGALIQACPCGENERIALAGLDARDGGHGAVARTTMFALDMARFCGPVLCALSGSYTIFVIELTDGSRHAIAVSCPGVAACRAVPRYTPGVGS